MRDDHSSLHLGLDNEIIVEFRHEYHNMHSLKRRLQDFGLWIILSRTIEGYQTKTKWIWQITRHLIDHSQSNLAFHLTGMLHTCSSTNYCFILSRTQFRCWTKTTAEAHKKKVFQLWPSLLLACGWSVFLSFTARSISISYIGYSGS